MKEEDLQALMSASKTEYECQLLTRHSTGHYKMFHCLHPLTKSTMASHISNGSLSVTPYDKVQTFINHYHSTDGHALHKG